MIAAWLLLLAAGDCATLPTPEALRAKAGDGQLVMGKLGVLLPRDWPPQSEQLTLYTYAAEASPTGVVRYRYRGPVARVVLSAGGATVIPLSTAMKPLGSHEPMDLDGARAETRRRAESALIAVVHGCKSVEAARPELEGYLRWLDGESHERAHLTAIGHSFVAWLCAGRSSPSWCAKVTSPE